MKRYTSIRTMVGGASSLRTATLNDVTYTVYPGICIVGDVVVHPMNSPGPELVPAQELSFTPQAWNTRPIIPDHPTDESGQAISALTPEIIEEQSYGLLFNTEFIDNKLKTELWINEAKALQLGGEPARVVSCLQKGETVEVSIGAYIDVEPKIGNWNGADYTGVWHNITPDHLAVGLNGAKGACSVEMGAGAPRINSAKVMRAAEDNSMSILRKMVHSAMKVLATNNDVQNALDDLLWENVNNYDWWVNVDQPEMIVYYRMWGNSNGIWAQTYNVDFNGIPISLNDDEYPVVKTTTYVRTAQGKDVPNPAPPVTPLGGTPMKVDEKVHALASELITNEKAPWKEETRAALEALSFEDLEEMLNLYNEEKAEDKVIEPAASTPVETPETPVVTREITESEYISLKAAADYVSNLTANHRVKLIASVKAVSGNRLTDAQLESMPTDVLEGLAPEAQPEQPVVTQQFSPPSLVNIPRFVPSDSAATKLPNGLTAAIENKDTN